MSRTELSDAAPGSKPEGSVSDIAYARLAHLIETCQLPPGWNLGNETEESAKLGMSRTPFREALQRLEQEGLVSRVAKHRTFVTKIDPQQFQHYVTVRRALEIELVRDAFEQGIKFDLKTIGKIHAQQVAAGKRGDTQTFLELDPQFHMAIASTSGNGPAIATLDTAWRHINRTRYIGVPQPDYITDTLDEHHAILQALRDHDLAGVEAAVRAHTGSAMRRRLKQLQETFPQAFIENAES